MVKTACYCTKPHPLNFAQTLIFPTHHPSERAGTSLEGNFEQIGCVCMQCTCVCSMFWSPGSLALA